MKWRYDRKTNFLSIEGKPPRGFPIAYSFDVSGKNTSAKLLDLIVQVSKKRWATDSILSDLVRKLDDLLDIQANVCSWGKDKNFDAVGHLEGRL